MTSGELFLRVAADETRTLAEYQKMVDDTELTEEEATVIKEIMGDEVNHAIAALVLARNILGIHIATDDITPDPNEIEVE